MGNVVAKEVCIVHYIILFVFLVISFLAEDVKLKFINTIFVSGSIKYFDCHSHDAIFESKVRKFVFAVAWCIYFLRDVSRPL